jgi:ribonuclease P protein component
MAGSPPNPPVAKLVQAADFERVLATPSKARSPHFAVHHLAARPVPTAWRRKHPVVPELSTADAPEAAVSVDNSSLPPSEPPEGQWLGVVVPKRHAKRAVTRTLVKRQMRAVFAGEAAHLGAGLWVLRLRSGFAAQAFPSASSDALRAAVRAELHTMLQRAAARGARG